MVIPKEVLSDFKEVYEKALKLVNEESKNDPPTEPYRSHYAARELLLQMKTNLQTSLASVLAEENEESKDYFTYKVILASVNRDLGRIYIFTEETSSGEQLLQECLQLMEPHKNEREAIIPYMGALNEIGIVYANRQEYKKSFEWLKKVEALYRAYKDCGFAEPLAITDIFGLADEVEVGKGAKEFESLYTYCSFYLAQVYGHLGELEKSADYCHMTLKRQLTAQSYESVDFALNAATLSQYYIGQNMFAEARHHLAAATLVMAEYETKMLTSDMTEQQRNDTLETFKHRYADVARCWAKYGLSLLLASKERLYNADEDNLVKETKNLNISPDKYKFPELNLTAYESRITADYCLTFDDAKQIYHFVINWLDQAKEYYQPETEASEYAKIIKDYAELYQHIAFFEEDPSNQFKMQKRRAKYYEDLIELLNPVFYMNICRECWYGAGLAYIAMLDIKLDIIKEHPNPPPQELHKVNQICQKAIKHYNDYIKTYLEKDSDTIKANIELDEERSVLYAYFHLGRLHYKLITPDHNLQLENMTNSLKYYKRFTDECTAREEAAKTLQSEIGVCREMVNLLPLKIANIRKRIGK